MKQGKSLENVKPLLKEMKPAGSIMSSVLGSLTQTVQRKTRLGPYSTTL